MFDGARDETFATFPRRNVVVIRDGVTTERANLGGDFFGRSDLARRSVESTA